MGQSHLQQVGKAFITPQPPSPSLPPTWLLPIHIPLLPLFPHQPLCIRRAPSACCRWVRASRCHPDAPLSNPSLRLALPHSNPAPASDPAPTTRALIHLWLLQVGGGFKVYRHSLGAFDRREVIATVPHRYPMAPAWVHDFPATPNHAVIPETPLYFNVRGP